MLNTVNKTVLVVEDDADIRDNLRLILEIEGYRVHTAENGRRALDLLAELSELPQLILLDLMMDVMDGKTFLRVLALEHPQTWAKIPVVVASAAGGPAAFEGLPASVAVLRKPVDLDDLLAAVERHCRVG